MQVVLGAVVESVNGIYDFPNASVKGLASIVG
jgi:hypothetical protein